MPIPLSQLMQDDDPDVGPPEGTFLICLSTKLGDELTAATDVYVELEAAIEKRRENDDVEGDRPRVGRRLGHKSTGKTLADLEAEAEVAAAAADEIRQRMVDRSVELRLVVREDFWQTFIRENPARDVTDNPTGARRDGRHAAGLCDVDALREQLDRFITRYGDEKPTPEAWAFVQAKSAPGERDRLASKVVQMHTQGVDLGKSRSELRARQRTGTGSE